MTLPRCNARASEAWPFPQKVKPPLPRTHYSWLKIAKKRLNEKIYRASIYRDRLNERRRALYALDPDRYNRWKNLKRYARAQVVIRPTVNLTEPPTLAKYVSRRNKTRIGVRP